MSLEAFLSPQSVAVVGASREPGKIGHEIVRNLVEGGFPGQIFPVNPNAQEILGRRCYPDVGAIGAVPDLVVIAVAPAAVAKVLRQCAAVRVQSVIVITAGFREVGAEGAALEHDLVRIARSSDIRLIGPNCMGLMVPASKLHASFGAVPPREGGIGYVSQSGALLAGLLDIADAKLMGFSVLFSIGNKADVDELDVLRLLGSDPHTTVIAGYLESISNGDAFVREAERVSQDKPILLLKAGGTSAGARAAAHHTGSEAGMESAYESAFARSGVIRCDSIKTQLDFAQGFASQRLPEGNNVAVVTNAGGPGIMTVDALERGGLTSAPLSPTTQQELAGELPAAANVRNPVDLLGDARADRYAFALESVLEDPLVHAAIVLLTPQAMTQATRSAEAVVQAARRHPEKPVLACFIGAGQTQEAVQVLRAGLVPCYDTPESAVATLRAMRDYDRWRRRPQRVVKLFPVNRHRVERIIERHLRRGIHEVGEMEGKEILEAYGFVTPEGSLATTAEQAANIADQLGYPVVLKIWSPEIVHKAEVGGVRLGLASRQDVMDSFDLMMYRIPRQRPEAQILGVLVQRMCKQGQEVILGMQRDPHFGPLMRFGVGGAMVEVLKDYVFYLAPLTADEARQMLASTRSYHLLGGVDHDAIAEALQRLSQLVTEFPRIQEMEINPFMVGPPGVPPIAVDARIRVAEAVG